MKQLFCQLALSCVTVLCSLAGEKIEDFILKVKMEYMSDMVDQHQNIL